MRLSIRSGKSGVRHRNDNVRCRGTLRPSRRPALRMRSHCSPLQRSLGCICIGPARRCRAHYNRLGTAVTPRQRAHSDRRGSLGCSRTCRSPSRRRARCSPVGPGNRAGPSREATPRLVAARAAAMERVAWCCSSDLPNQSGSGRCRRRMSRG